MMSHPASALRLSRPFLILAPLAAVALLWSYWTTLAEITWRWSHDPQYSHGYLVPIFAGYLLWRRRSLLDGAASQLSWVGLALVAASALFRLAGTYYHYTYFDQMSLLPTLLGLALLAGGWPAARWSWPALAFLAFAIPLPHSWSLALSAPMQAFATTVSTFCLQVIGRPALAEGNVILLNDIELGIVEACSGLRMLVVFFALSTAVAMLARKPLWERLLLAASAIPIALAANILRITLTGLAYDLLGNNWGGNMLHDAFGLLMPLIGLALLGVELWILRHLLLENDRRLRPSQVTLQRVEVSPLGLYQGTGPTRRERRAAAAAAAATAQPAAPAPAAPASAVPQS